MSSHASGSGLCLIDTMSPACRGVWWARDAHPARPPAARGTPCYTAMGRVTARLPTCPPAPHPLSCLHSYPSDLGNVEQA